MIDTNEHGEHIVATGDASTVNRESARRTRRSFLVGGAAAAAGAGAAYWINNSKPLGRLQAGLRDTLDTDAAINRAVWGERGLTPTYALTDAKPLRLNGVVGLAENLVPESWRLQLVGAANAASSPLYAPDVTAWEYKYAGDMVPAAEIADEKTAPGTGAPGAQNGDQQDTGQANTPTPPPASDNTLNPGGASDSAAGAAIAAMFENAAKAAAPKQTKRNIGSDEAGASFSSLDIGTPGLLLTMADLMKLPRVEFVTQFKCIEGWSNVTQWAGVRLRDLIEAYPPAKINGREPRYVYMETPDGNYYAGYNMSAARHPQSLLVTEMGGRPLAQEHGAPLRLHMPIKYGYKQLKRIGLIAFTDTKPDDYWTKLGYDWYAGL